MPLNMQQCKSKIYQILSNDRYITEELGFDYNSFIMSMNTPQEINARTKQIFIYDTISQKTESPLFVNMCFEIDVSVPYEDNVAVECMEQIVALLNGRKMPQRKVMHLYDAPREIAGQSGFVVMGVKFGIYSTIFNIAKK